MGRFLTGAALLCGLAGCAAGGPSMARTGHCTLLAAAGQALTGRPCAPPALPPAPYCTRSLADVDCWSDPGLLADRPPQVADGGWQAPPLARRRGVGPPAIPSAPPAGGRGEGPSSIEAALPASHPGATPGAPPGVPLGTASPGGG